MAILTGIFRKQTGSIGDMTLRRVNGVTITSEKITRNNSKTFHQMVQRVQLANLVNIWRSFTGNLHLAFENRPVLTSDFNMFVSANWGLVPVYLTKDQARMGGAVIGGLQVTRGSLPSIDINASTDGVPYSDIALSGLSIGEDTTLADFSNAVINNNNSWTNGDQLSAFIATQSVNSVTNVPYVQIKAYEVTLDTEDHDTLLMDIVTPDAFSVVEGKLGASGTIQGGIVWIHSRKTSNGTQVSTQRIFASNTILANFQSATQRTAAIQSYNGKVSEEFLTPNVDWTAEAA